MTDTSSFTIERRFDATPEELWDAWTNPDEAAHWWHPRGVHTPRDTVQIDARVGGRYSYTMVHDETGETYPTAGVYRKVDPPNRLAFTWGADGDDPDSCPLIEVDIMADGGGSKMIFTMTRLDRDHDGVRTGWYEALDMLAGHLGGDR